MTIHNTLKKLSIFKSQDANDLGYTNTDLVRLCEKGTLIKLDRGIYQHSGADIDPNTLEFATACTRFGPDAVIGGVSALFFHNLTENIPNKVWVLMPTEKTTVDSKYRFIRSLTSLSIGIEKHKHFKITNIERTLVESFYFSTKIGLDSAMHATGVAFKNEQTSLSKMVAVAKKLKLQKFLDKHWEALEAMQETL